MAVAIRLITSVILADFAHSNKWL